MSWGDARPKSLARQGLAYDSFYKQPPTFAVRLRRYHTSSQNPDIGRLKIVSYASLAVGVASMVFVAVLAGQLNAFYHQNGDQAGTTTTTSYQAISASGSLITPQLSLSDAPPI